MALPVAFGLLALLDWWNHLYYSFNRIPVILAVITIVGLMFAALPLLWLSKGSKPG